MANKITVLLDFVTGKAQQGIKGFRQSVNEAEGAVGKFRAGWSSAMATVQANAGNLALVAGSALIAFGAKAVSAFQSAALEAGKFADATGLTNEAASRLLEVAGDIGVSVGTVESAVAKMNQAIGTGGPLIDELGLSLQTTSDGAADVNATFLDTINRINAIEDPTRRGAAAAKVFGRNYKEAAELIGLSADELRAKLEGVADAQVFDDEDVTQARELREELDSVSDSAGRVSRAFAEALVPILADAAGTVNNLIDSYDRLKAKIPDAASGGPVGTLVGGLVNPTTALAGALDGLDRASARLDQALGADAPGVAAIRDAVQGAADGVDDLTGAAEELGPRWAAAAIPLTAASGAFAEMGVSADVAAEALQREADAEEASRIAIEERNQALQDSIDHLHDYERAQLDVADAQDRLATALADYATLITEGTVSAEEKARADESVTDAQSDQADAAEDLSKAQADLADVIASSIPTDREKADSLRKVEDAQRGLEDAIRGVERANRAVQDQDKRLIDARKKLAEFDAPPIDERIKKTAAFKEAEREKALAEERAGLVADIEDAELGLNDAQRQVIDANRQVQDATLRLNDAQAENNRLLTVGKDVADAKSAATDRVKDAENRLAEAVAAAVEAQHERDDLLTDSIATDEEKEDSVRDIERAELDLITALEDQATAFATQAGALAGTAGSLALVRQELERIVDLNPQLQPAIDLLNAGGAGAVFSPLPVGAREGFTLNVAPGAIIVSGAVSGEQIVDALKDYERRNGPR